MKMLYCKRLIIILFAIFFLVNNNLYANIGDSSKVNLVSFNNNQVRKIFKTISDESNRNHNQFDDFIIYGFEQDGEEYITIFFNDRWLLPYIKKSIEYDLGYCVKIQGYMQYKKHNCLFYVLPDFFRKKKRRVDIPDHIYRLDSKAADYITRNFSCNDTIFTNIHYRGITYRYRNGKFVQQGVTLINGSIKYYDL